MRPSLLYRALARAAVAGLPLAARFSSKLARGLAGRRESGARLLAWATRERDPARPLIWVHAASAGEALQARAVIGRLRQRRPEWQVVFTYFSPSAEGVAATIPAEAAGYLPYDVWNRVTPLVHALAPQALVFTKLDVWPALTLAAAAAGAAVVLVAGTVSPVSGRLRRPVRALLRPAYAALTAAGAISPDDGDRLAQLGVPPDRVRVVGDPRFDSVVEVVATTPADEPLHSLGSGGQALVAGSTWPADEAVLLGAFRLVREAYPRAQLLLAPHEPTRAHLDGVRTAARRQGLPPPVMLSAAPGPVPFLLVDRIGVLARLYGAGQVAYVGGGFGRAGLHSVLEPAAWGRPVVFGPRWHRSREAGLLLRAGGGLALPAGRGAVVALARQWTEWLQDGAAREAAGRRAFGVVQAGLGAAEQNAALVEQAVTGTGAAGAR